MTSVSKNLLFWRSFTFSENLYLLNNCYSVCVNILRASSADGLLWFFLKLETVSYKHWSDCRTSPMEDLGIKFDNKLAFTEHIRSLCKKANGKLHALERISNCLSIEKRKVLAHSFVASQTAYCPLIWSFSNRTVMEKLERFNEKANSLFLDTTQKANTNLHSHYCESLLKEVF